jgi:hypothetical protein
MPMYRLHVEAVYSFDFPVEAENEKQLQSYSKI